MTAPKMDMDFTLVDPALKDLSERWNTLVGEWQENATEARRHEAFGPADTLVRAFLAGYRPKEEGLRKAADERIKQYGALVSTGREAVEIYRRGDNTSAIQFPTAN